MTANRTVRTGLTTSAVLSVCSFSVCYFRHNHPNVDLTNVFVDSHGSGQLHSWGRHSSDITMDLQAHFGLQLVVAR